MDGSERNRVDRKTLKKILFFAAVLVVMATIVIGKLANYQIGNYEYYQAKVLSTLTHENVVNPERGDITDSEGLILATNKVVYNVIISPKDIKDTTEANIQKNSDGKASNDVYYSWTSEDGKASYKGTDAKTFIVTFLSNLTGVSYDEIMEKANKEERKYEVIAKEVEEDVHDKIVAFKDEYGFRIEIFFESSFKRYYPYGNLASHVIGFTSGEGFGREGIESYYNNLLEGKSGKYIVAQDAKSNEMPFEFESYIAEQNGRKIVTTLNTYIQRALEKQLEKTYHDSEAANRVTGIVMDVETGGILAMATYPSYDLNSPYTLDEDSEKELDLIADKDSEEYQKKYSELLFQMWRNKAVSETYEPGSTFKIMTTAMALEDKAVSFDDYFTCAGSYYVEGWGKPIGCYNLDGHGTLKFRYGLQQSCNPILMQVAQKIGRERFYKYFESFGYMSRTGIDLPAESFGIYSSEENFGNVSLAVYAFGQTFRTTPIQQLTAITAIANGGYYVTPHVLKEVRDDSDTVIATYETDVKRQIVSTDVCRSIAEALEEGVAGNGQAKNAYVKGYRVAAKTGTSEKMDTPDENGEYTLRVGSCVAFAPYDDPIISALIVVDEPMIESVYGGVVAAPYISDLLSEVLVYLGVEQQYTEEDLQALDVTVSNYIGGTPEAAKEDLELAGLSCIVIGSGDTITSQSPAAGSVMRKDSGRVYVYCGDGAADNMTTVPDVVWSTSEAASSILYNSGLNIKITGASGSSATVISQSIEPGAAVENGTVIEIEVIHLDTVD